MRSVKERGMEELNLFKNRVVRAFGLGRIQREDFDNLFNKVEDLKEDVENLEELDEEAEIVSAK